MLIFQAAALALLVAGPPPTEPIARLFGQRLNRFAEQLWTTQHLEQGNQAVAPISVGICLSMLIDGANQPTRDQLLKTLGLTGMRPQEIDQGVAALRSSFSQDADLSFTMVNGVWVRGDMKVLAAYRKTIKTSYGGEVKRFARPDQRTLKEINDWVKLHTKDRIGKIFDRLDADTSALLVNALTFDGKWKTPFDKQMTYQAPFHRSQGSLVEVPTMRKRGAFMVERHDRFSALTMPYQGERFAMIFMRPDDESSPSKALSTWLAERTPHMEPNLSANEIQIPRFHIECSYDLKPTLGAMGLAPLYADAKLGLIAPDLDRHTKIDQIQHKTFIKVDEEGTKAAAATGVAVATRAIMQEMTFKLDRPFAYAIVDKSTGAIIMMGTVTDPRE